MTSIEQFSFLGLFACYIYLLIIFKGDPLKSPNRKINPTHWEKQGVVKKRKGRRKGEKGTKGGRKERKEGGKERRKESFTTN